MRAFSALEQAANALATAALVANLGVMTNAAYDHMLQLPTMLAEGLQQRIARHSLPWHVTTIDR